jgi:hypothetical protein
MASKGSVNSDPITFEQEIHRLHELVDGCGARVTWNDRIPDPDNPRQPRQIDITVRRKNHLAIIECRLHKKPQGVKWIEELVGRRMSLEADSAIAVSASGFTRGAVSKARRFGIILRDLQALTPIEVQNWGCQIALTVYYYQFLNLELTLKLDPQSIPYIRHETLASELKVFAGRRSLINATMIKLDELNPLVNEKVRQRDHKFRIAGRFEGFHVCGQLVREVELAGAARLVEKPIILCRNAGYGDPQEAAGCRTVVVQKEISGATGVTVQDAYRMATVVDLGSLELPPNSQLRYVRTVANKIMDMDSFELLDPQRLYMTSGSMAVNIETTTQD